MMNTRTTAIITILANGQRKFVEQWCSIRPKFNVMDGCGKGWIKTRFFCGATKLAAAPIPISAPPACLLVFLYHTINDEFHIIAVARSFLAGYGNIERPQWKID